MSLADHLRAMPKVELHVHLEGSIQPHTLLELAERNKIDLPCSTVNEIRALYRYRDFVRFAEIFIMTGRCLRRPEDFCLVTERMGVSMADQNIRYAEVFWTPQLYTDGTLSLDVILDGLEEGRRRVRQVQGIELRWIPDVVRSLPLPKKELLDWLLSPGVRERGVVALGLGGPEDGHPPEPFASVFQRARDVGLPANPHAGEFGGPSSVWGALQSLKASRIGHGVRSIEDPTLVQYLAEHQVPLEVSPTSNIELGIYPIYEQHPLKHLVEAGCRVTIHSDDPALFETTLSDEYQHAIVNCGLTLEQLEEAALHAVDASYLPEVEKADMLRTFAAEYQRRRSSHQ